MKIQDIIIKLLLKQPFYGYLASSITILQNDNILDTKMIYFPSPTLYYNRIWYENLDENRASGIIMHELLHLVLLHQFRRKGRDVLLWDAACDMAVNEYLSEEMLSDTALTVVKVALSIHEEIPSYKSAEFYYDILNKLEENISLFEMDKQISIRIGGGKELLVKKQVEMDSEITEVGKHAVESMLNQMVEQSKEEGEIPEGLLENIEEVYNENAVDWKNIFKRFLIGRGRMESRKSYKKESRRYEGFPGNKRSIGLRCLLAIDESGSIPDGQVVSFYNELMDINKITSAEIYVTEFDTTCSKPVLIENYVKTQKRVKNGGTDFRPIFKLADDMHIELLICFTDGDGAVPEYVNQRVLWVLTKNGKKPAEYGFDVKL